MSAYVHLLYAERALKELRKLDRKERQRILDKLETYAALPDPLSSAKVLTGALAGFYRYRIGVYRVIFEVHPNGEITVLYVLSVKHRKDVYR